MLSEFLRSGEVQVTLQWDFLTWQSYLENEAVCLRYDDGSCGGRQECNIMEHPNRAARFATPSRIQPRIILTFPNASNVSYKALELEMKAFQRCEMQTGVRSPLQCLTMGVGFCAFGLELLDGGDPSDPKFTPPTHLRSIAAHWPEATPHKQALAGLSQNSTPPARLNLTPEKFHPQYPKK
jgi:hypothetical protein